MRSSEDYLHAFLLAFLNLTITAWLWPGEQVTSWEFLLGNCQSLQRLSVPAVFITPGFAKAPADGPHQHPLRTLELTSAGCRDEATGLAHLDIVNTFEAFLRNLKELHVAREICCRRESHPILCRLASQASEGNDQARPLRTLRPGKAAGRDEQELLTIIFHFGDVKE